MHITVNLNDLKAGIGKVEKCLPSKATIAITEGVFIRADENINLIATDLENTMMVKITGEVKEQGNAVINGKKFAALVKQLDGSIEIKTEGDSVEVKNNGRKYAFNSYDPDEFPVFPELKDYVEFTMPPKILSEGIKSVLPFVDAQEPRPQFRGVLIDTEADIINFVGTDTRSLALYRITKQSGLNQYKALLPVKAANILTSIISDAPEITANKNIVAFKFLDDVVLISQLLSGAEDFPEYNKVIPAKELNTAVCKKGILLSALRRLNIFTSERYNKVIVNLAENQAEMVVISPDSGKAVEVIELAHNGAIKIAFAMEAFLTAIQAVQGEEILISYTKGEQPVIVQSAGSEEHKVVVMPLKLEKDG